MPNLSRGRTDLQAAAEAFVALVRLVPDGAWGDPGLGVWTVRELVGHTARAFRTVEEYLAEPSDVPPTLADPVAYFRGAVGISNSDAVAERGREAGVALGDRPVEAIEELTARVLAFVDASDDDLVVVTRLGSLRLADYLPTRTFELTVHSLDLKVAVGDVPWALPAGPLESVAHLLTDLAIEQGLGPDLLLALTGRRPLPEGTCVL